MKKIYVSCFVILATTFSSCKKFLDVNTNPNAPSKVTSNMYLAPMLHWMITDAAYEGRHIGRYTQNWALPGTSLSTWDRMGYDAGSDNGAQTYRDVYWVLGQNLIDMMTKAEAEQRWDILGLGYILKAWGWQTLTGIHGEITIKEAFMPEKTTFAFDNQQFAYEESRRLLNLGIQYLQRTDGFVSSTNMAVGDKIYNGNRSKWIKYAYGLLAMNLNHYSNKASYDPVAVIDAVDKSFASSADDLLLTYTNTGNDDSNFMGPRRQNFQNYRQTEFIVRLMNGTQFGGVVDPRMSRMLARNPGGTYSGVNINSTYSATAQAAATYPNNMWNYAANIAGGLPTMYLFHDKSRYPGMTYSQLQFIKAEAAYKMGRKDVALGAYKNALEAHIDFVNARNTDNVQLATQITTTEKTDFLSRTEILPTDPNNLTLSMIMCQKYIAQWGWGHYETWMDLRRYSYTGLEPGTTSQVFLGFTLPTSLFGDNNGLPVQRIRTRFNSEYVWNRAELDKIGGLAVDFHTVPMWITQP